MAADGNTVFDLIKTEAHGEIQGWTKFSRLKMERLHQRFFNKLRIKVSRVDKLSTGVGYG